MHADCTPIQLSFQGLGSRRVEASFDGGAITSDAGGLLLREVARGTQLIRRFAECFTDHRNPELIEH
ncbi:MAG: transposase, partial [Deinococcales bacterium]